ncbi:conserved hypothetical protein [Mycobacterium tuberculosis]|nr:conserved hypothetical protein [Mycobacterium tuberculosis]
MRRLNAREQRSKEQFREELRSAAMALLNRHWITKKKHPQLYLTVKDHYEKLRQWFLDHAGFSLILTRHFAKLEKVPGSYQPWMGIRGFYTPRDYALFTYGLWYLEGRGEGDQFLLSEMVDAIRDHLLTQDVQMDWTLYDHRLSMSRALRKLRELDALTAVEGEEGDWAREGGGRNVLYEASPMARYVLRRFAKELMAYDSMDALIEPEVAVLRPSDAESVSAGQADVAARRQRIFRRLLQEPVVYDWQWTDEERRYVQMQRSWLIEQMHEMTGLEGRRFREGLLFSWPELTGEPELFPTLSAASDLTVLLAGEIRRQSALSGNGYEEDSYGNMVLTRAEFEGLLLRLKEFHGDYWSKEHREKTSAALADELIDLMEEWNLGKRDGSLRVVLYPALMRWNGSYEWGEER